MFTVLNPDLIFLKKSDLPIDFFNLFPDVLFFEHAQYIYIVNPEFRRLASRKGVFTKDVSDEFLFKTNKNGMISECCGVCEHRLEKATQKSCRTCNFKPLLTEKSFSAKEISQFLINAGLIFEEPTKFQERVYSSNPYKNVDRMLIDLNKMQSDPNCLIKIEGEDGGKLKFSLLRWRMGSDDKILELERITLNSKPTELPSIYALYFHNSAITSKNSKGNHQTLLSRICSSYEYENDTLALRASETASFPQYMMAKELQYAHLYPVSTELKLVAKTANGIYVTDEMSMYQQKPIAEFTRFSYVTEKPRYEKAEDNIYLHNENYFYQRLGTCDSFRFMKSKTGTHLDFCSTSTVPEYQYYTTFSEMMASLSDYQREKCEIEVFHPRFIGGDGETKHYTPGSIVRIVNPWVDHEPLRHVLGEVIREENGKVIVGFYNQFFSEPFRADEIILYKTK
jgi:hypothetical protein